MVKNAALTLRVSPADFCAELKLRAGKLQKIFTGVTPSAASNAYTQRAVVVNSLTCIIHELECHPERSARVVVPTRVLCGSGGRGVEGPWVYEFSLLGRKNASSLDSAAKPRPRSG